MKPRYSGLKPLKHAIIGPEPQPFWSSYTSYGIFKGSGIYLRVNIQTVQIIPTCNNFNAMKVKFRWKPILIQQKTRFIAQDEIADSLSCHEQNFVAIIPL